MKEPDAVLWVIAGALVIMALVRYMPETAGWVLLAVVLAMLVSAHSKGAMEWTL